MLYTNYLLYGITGISIFLFILILVLIIALAKNKNASLQGSAQYISERCPTCGQILEPDWNRCPFCMDIVGPSRTYQRKPARHDVRSIGLLINKTGSDRGKVHKIDNNIITIGRGNQNDVIINDNLVSPRHSKIWFANDKFFIQDLQSQEGTKVNDKFINQMELYNDDLIEIADNFFAFKVLD